MGHRLRRRGGSRRRRGSGDSGTSFGDAADDRIFTPLIDIFIAIVFFLMVGMTSGGGFVSVTPEVRLPRSAGQQATGQQTGQADSVTVVTLFAWFHGSVLPPYGLLDFDV
jgi:biopolymer transport protein ExbD